jgi:hypothetical protein
MTIFRLCNFTCRYIDDIVSSHITRFDDYVHRIYPIKHDIPVQASHDGERIAVKVMA